MKKELPVLVFAVFCLSAAKAQTTVTIQPDATAGKDVYLNDFAPTTNYANHNDIDAMAWTTSGTPSKARSLFEFDLTGISPGSVVVTAYLTLYNNPTSANNSGMHSNASGPNTSLVQKVTSSWSESTVTWNTQPSVTTVDEATIPATTSSNQDAIDIDVTAMVQDMINNPSTNFGFMLRLNVESEYRCQIYASSDNANAAKHPKLVINYSPVGVKEVSPDFFTSSMVPTILSNQSYIEIPQNESNDFSLMVFDASGKNIQVNQVNNGNRIIINRGSMAQGFYTYQLVKKGLVHSTGKFIVE